MMMKKKMHGVNQMNQIIITKKQKTKTKKEGKAKQAKQIKQEKGVIGEKMKREDELGTHDVLTMMNHYQIRI